MEPNEDCKYMIDDVIFDEQQMLEMFGLIAAILQKAEDGPTVC